VTALTEESGAVKDASVLGKRIQCVDFAKEVEMGSVLCVFELFGSHTMSENGDGQTVKMSSHHS
jgi:hypothetical protein